MPAHLISLNPVDELPDPEDFEIGYPVIFEGALYVVMEVDEERTFVPVGGGGSGSGDGSIVSSGDPDAFVATEGGAGVRLMNVSGNEFRIIVDMNGDLEIIPIAPE